MLAYYFRQAFEIAREEGVAELLNRSDRFLSRRVQRAVSSVKRGYYNRLRWRNSYPDPFRLIYADPADIEYYLLASEYTDWARNQTVPDEVEHLYDIEKGGFHRRKNIGRIVGGDWDKYRKPLDKNRIYRSLREVFVEGKDWKETEFIKDHLEVINIKGSTYGYETEEEFLEKRTEYIEQLYQSIQQNGYLTQQEAPNDDRNKDKFHEISVNIGRDGELIFNNRSGHHRLSLAKILDLDEIPVLVITRHELWQELRSDICKNGFTDKYPQKLRDHPDLQDIVD